MCVACRAIAEDARMSGSHAGLVLLKVLREIGGHCDLQHSNLTPRATMVVLRGQLVPDLGSLWSGSDVLQHCPS